MVPFVQELINLSQIENVQKASEYDQNVQKAREYD